MRRPCYVWAASAIFRVGLINMHLTAPYNWENVYSVIEPQINAAGIHRWPFVPSFPLDVRFFILDGPGEIRMNRHDYFELLYVLSGKAVFQVQERSLLVKAGELAVMGSDLYHRIIVRGRGSRPKFAVLFFQPELIRAVEASGEELEYLMPFLAQDANFPHVVSPDTGIPAQVFELIQRIRAISPATSNRARLSVKTYLKMILVLLVNHYGDHAETRKIHHRRQEALERLQPLFEFLERHYDEPITVEAASEIMAMSPSYFMRSFKRATGQSFHAYLNHFRIAKAEVLLSSTARPIAEIGQDVGFCNQSYFGVVFRELVKMTPLAYRRKFSRSSQSAPSHSVSALSPELQGLAPR